MHIYGNTSIYFSDIQLYTERQKKKDTHYNNYPTLHSVSKEPKSAIQKLSLTFFCNLYNLFLNNDNDGIIIIIFFFYTIVKDIIATADLCHCLAALI